MAIYKTKPTGNFTPIANEVFSRGIPATALVVLLYLLTKPNNWQPQIKDLTKQLKLSTYAARQAMTWLLNAGYMHYKRLESGHTRWDVFDSPQRPLETASVPAPEQKPQMEKPHVEIQDVLINKELIVKNNKNNNSASQRPQAPPTPTQTTVVVSPEIATPTNPDAVLADIAGIPRQQQAIAKNMLASIPADSVLVVLASFHLACKTQEIKNPVGYLTSLVKAVKNGTFTAPNTTYTESSADRIAREERARQEAAKRHKRESLSEWQSMMKQKYGEKMAEKTQQPIKPFDFSALRRMIA